MQLQNLLKQFFFYCRLPQYIVFRKRCENSSEGSSEAEKREKKGKLMTKDKKRTLKRL